MVGSLVVVKRLTFMALGIAHAVLGGMGVAHLLGCSPLGGAAVAAVIVLGALWLRRPRARSCSRRGPSPPR